MKKLEKHRVFVQIGTNDGKDKFRDLVRHYSPKKVVLVEPNKALNSRIWESYSGIPYNSKVVIENVAITKESNGIVKLVIPDEEYRGNHNYTSKHFSLLPMDNWGKEFRHFMFAPSMTFSQLCHKYEITHINFLQLDTEGYDSEIIKSIDFKEVSIDLLQFEKWDFPVEVFSRHGAKAEEYGVNGMKQAVGILITQGYEIKEMKRDIIAVKNGQ